MKKIVKVDGVHRGEINVSPQSNITCTAWNDQEALVAEIKGELGAPRTFAITASIGSTAAVSVHHIPENRVRVVALTVERHLYDLITKIDGGEATESALLQLGYTL